jgi:hypothetical protein
MLSHPLTPLHVLKGPTVQGFFTKERGFFFSSSLATVAVGRRKGSTEN